jgi:exopolysaccharide production protein ExoY
MEALDLTPDALAPAGASRLVHPTFEQREPDRAIETELRPEIVVRSAFAAEFPLTARRSRLRGRAYEFAKRFLDLVLGLLLLLLALPLMAGAALLVAWTTPGPLLFRQRRLGRGGREFWCLKFRTMVQDAEQRLHADPALRARYDASYKIKGDPRLTPVGGFLRKASIDELPQLLNVIAGEMTLIGPRPILTRELEKYGDCAEELLTVKPGLGGLWQVCGRSDTSYAERVYLDTLYIRRRCMALDLKLLVKTAAAVLAARGSR